VPAGLWQKGTIIYADSTAGTSGPQLLYQATGAANLRLRARAGRCRSRRALQLTPATAGGGDSGDLVAVYLTNGTRTSAGPGPGVKRLPSAEAGALIRARLATYGERPPRGYADGGTDGERTGTSGRQPG
jgi:hypothetical protein